MKKKALTIREANSIIPAIRPIVIDLMESWLRIFTMNRAKDIVTDRFDHSAGGSFLPYSLFVEIERYHEKVEDLAVYGCTVKDPRRGQVRIPGTRGGRPVYFLWEIGAPAVRLYTSPPRRIHEEDNRSEGNS